MYSLLSCSGTTLAHCSPFLFIFDFAFISFSPLPFSFIIERPVPSNALLSIEFSPFHHFRVDNNPFAAFPPGRFLGSFYFFFSFPPFDFFSLDFDVRGTVRFFQEEYISRVRLRVRFCFKSCLGGLSIGFFIITLFGGRCKYEPAVFIDCLTFFLSSIISSTISLGSRISVLVIPSSYIVYNKPTWNQRDGGKGQGGEDRKGKAGESLGQTHLKSSPFE